MKIKSTSPLFEPFECDAVVTSHHPRSCFGHAVLLLVGPDGGAVGPQEAEFAGYEVVGATDEERTKLAEAGYRLKGLMQTMAVGAAAGVGH
jgi:hypothetical protein